MIHRRGFVATALGQMHYRQAGSGGDNPVMLLHAAPAASVTLVPLIEALGATRAVYAPDCPGMGDSTPLAVDAPDLPMLARATWQTADALGLGRIDLYGSLTGARIAVEMAVCFPHRVRRLALDGMSLMEGDEQADYVANYAPCIVPDLAGTQLAAAWQFCRDQYLFFPWYKSDAAHRRAVGLPAPELLHAKLLDVLKSLDSFPAVLRASLLYPARARLALLAVPTLADKSLSGLIADLKVMHTPIMEPLTANAARVAAKAAEIIAFLDGAGLDGAGS